MIHAPDDGRNENALMDYRKLADQWSAHGTTRNEIISRLVRYNSERGRPVHDQDIFELVRLVTEGPPAKPAPNKPPERSEDVTEETEKQKKTEETDRNLPKASESERGGCPPPGGGADKDECKDEQTPTPQDAFRAELEAGVLFTLPFPAYLARAAEEYRRHEEENFPQEWQVLFYFVRLVKAHPAMMGKSAKLAFREVRKVLEAWDRDNDDQEPDDWLHWLGVDRDDAEAVFLDTWEKVRFLPGQDPLTNAINLAHQYPLMLSRELALERPETYPMFVSLAGWLQVVMGDQPIKLPCREVGKLLHLLPMTISRLRKMAVEDGFLQEVKSHRFAGKRGAGEATSFRFDVSKADILQERAQ